jgi:hypothetical protein
LLSVMPYLMAFDALLNLLNVSQCRGG